MPKKGSNGTGTPPASLDWDAINASLSLAALDKREARNAEARKERPFDPWPMGVFVGEVVTPQQETRGEFGMFPWVVFVLVTIDRGSGPEPGDGELIQAIVPRGNFKAGDFHGMQKGARFAAMYHGKSSYGGIDRHDLTIRRL